MKKHILFGASQSKGKVKIWVAQYESQSWALAVILNFDI